MTTTTHTSGGQNYTTLDTIHADADLATRWATITERANGWSVSIYNATGQTVTGYTTRDIQTAWNLAIARRAGTVYASDRALDALTDYAPAA